jgi:hypothetical protein
MSVDTTACTKEEWDAARRLTEAVNLHVLAHRAQLGAGRDTPGYVAVRLADGRSPDGVLYDTRRDAARHWPPYPDGMTYVKVGRDDMSVKEGLIVLMLHRQAYAKGVVFSEEEIVVPHRLELAAPFIPRTISAVLPDTFRRHPRG